MALDGAWNAYIFRDGKSSIAGGDLVNGLAQGLIACGNAGPQGNRTALIDLLMRAGELECALLDSNSTHSATASSITDELALGLVVGAPVFGEELAHRVSTIIPPQQVTVSPPEGFAYYSLHPLDFANLARKIPVQSKYVAVIGIRSIGTTLSAVVQAALRLQGAHVERTTVRPAGHPYDRRTQLASEQLRWIRDMQSHDAGFLVVDEGPGMSGSSFLSVGDALLSAGVPRANVAFLGSRHVDPQSLTAPHAAERWSAYRSYFTPGTAHLPKGAKIFIAGGIWRAHVFPDERQWPASWTLMERAKYFSSDKNLVYKFEGLGRFGQAVHDRSVLVALAGFGPMPVALDEGFGVFPRLQGEPLSSTDVDQVLLQRLADYCAFRANTIHSSIPSNRDLQTMLLFNVKEEFGIELPDDISELHVEKPVISDARMLPHKWIRTNQGVFKVDSAAHGDDHFFPGPTDIAWDLAGTIVEWQLAPDAAQNFIERYHCVSGDNPRERLQPYLLAYSIFRSQYCKMAAANMKGTHEEPRLVRDYQRYRACAQQYLARHADTTPERKVRRADAASELSAA